MIRCAIYDRVSTDLQVKEGLSLEAQRKLLTDYATDHHYEIVDYYTDEGITARKKMQNRKELLRLLEDVKKDKIDLILVTKLDRWFRNIKDYHNTQAILEAHHCNWKTVLEEYDTSTSNGRFAINIMLSVNENECDRDSERIRAVFDYKKSRREYLSGRPAYGYLTDENKHLVKDPATKQIVEDVFACYFATYSKRETVRRIQDVYRESAPSVGQILRILSSDTYTGRLYGIDHYCEAYISPKQQAKIKIITDSKIIPHQQEPFLFSSLIRCPGCGKHLSGFLRKYKCKNGTVSVSKRYRCSSKYRTCPGSVSLSEQKVEDYLLSHIFKFADKEVFTLHIRNLCSVNTIGLTTAKPIHTDMSYSEARLLEEQNRLNKLYIKGRIQETFYEESFQKLQEKINSTIRVEYYDKTPITKEKSHKPGKNISFSGGIRMLYDSLDAAHKKVFWKELLSDIEIDPTDRSFRLVFSVQETSASR